MCDVSAYQPYVGSRVEIDREGGDNELKLALTLKEFKELRRGDEKKIGSS